MLVVDKDGKLRGLVTASDVERITGERLTDLGIAPETVQIAGQAGGLPSMVDCDVKRQKAGPPDRGTDPHIGFFEFEVRGSRDARSA